MRLTRQRTSKGRTACWSGIMVCGAAISIVAAVNYCLLQCTQLCVFRAVTGLPCPGCGLTHAASSLLRGEVVESLLYHALFVPYVVTIGANTITWDFFALNWLRSRGWLWTVLIASVGSYAIRLMVFFPDGPSPMVYDRRCYLFRGLQIIRELYAWVCHS